MRTMAGSAAAPWRLATEDEENVEGFDPDLDEDGEFDDEDDLDEDEDDLDDDDDDDDDDLDDDLIDLDDEFDTDDDEKPHPGRFDE
jgi:hypothetical protein